MKSRCIGGRMKFQRIGKLSWVRQRAVTFDRASGSGLIREGSRNPRAPETRGIWAFPHPYFDPYFASFQYHLATPKRFFAAREQLTAACDNGEISPDELLERCDEVDRQFAAWRRTEAGRVALSVRTFEVSGSIYTKLEVPGAPITHGADGWALCPIEEFARLLARQYAKDLGGARATERAMVVEPGAKMTAQQLQVRNWRSWPCSVDHLEVFLPASGCRIH